MNDICYLRCYRYRAGMDYDPEQIWELVQGHGGFISIQGDTIFFWISSAYEALLVLKYAELERYRSRDYIA